jgi:hypothetical protein
MTRACSPEGGGIAGTADQNSFFMLRMSGFLILAEPVFPGVLSPQVHEP